MFSARERGYDSPLPGARQGHEGGQCPLTSRARGLCPCCHSPSLNLGDLQDTAQVSLTGASALSTNFFPFPCFLKRFLCCNSHPCPAWGHSRGRRGTASVRARGHEVWGARVARCQQRPGAPPFPAARGALPPPESHQGSDTALPVSPGSRDTVGDRPGGDLLRELFQARRAPCSTPNPARAQRQMWWWHKGVK